MFGPGGGPGLGRRWRGASGCVRPQGAVLYEHVFERLRLFKRRSHGWTWI